MLTYSHNHARGILLWQCSCHRNAKENFESFFNCDAKFNISDYYGTQVYFFSVWCWFLCVTSLTMTSSMLKSSLKFWDTSFKFWLCPWIVIWFFFTSLCGRQISYKPWSFQNTGKYWNNEALALNWIGYCKNTFASFRKWFVVSSSVLLNSVNEWLLSCIRPFSCLHDQLSSIYSIRSTHTEDWLNPI